MGEWFYTISESIMASGLKGNELLVYALICNKSVMQSGCWYGRIETLCTMCGIASRQTAHSILRKLVDKGLISKTTIVIDGEPRPAYFGVQKLDRGVQKLDRGCPKVGHKDKDIYINNTLSFNSESKSKFSKPTIEEIREYCKSRNNNVDAEAFFAFYESKGWMVGKSPMKNWQSAVITWEKRESENPRQAAPVQRQPKESVGAYNIRQIKEIFGDDAFGSMNMPTGKEVCDEQ